MRCALSLSMERPPTSSSPSVHWPSSRSESVMADDERERASKFIVVPLELDEANAYVDRHHRHSNEATGHRFSIGAALGSEIVGVAIVGRPLARPLQDGWTVEALRVCSIGERNVNSFLYGACWRAARTLGYR